MSDLVYVFERMRGMLDTPAMIHLGLTGEQAQVLEDGEGRVPNLASREG